MNGNTIWSFEPNGYSARPAVVQLQSVSKHAPLHSIASPAPAGSRSVLHWQQLDRTQQTRPADRSLQQQRQQEQQQQQQEQRQQHHKTQVTWQQLGQGHSCQVVQQLQQQLTTTGQSIAQHVQGGSWLDLDTAASQQQLVDQLTGIELANNQQWQWHVVKCCATPVLLGDVGHTSSLLGQPQAASAAAPLPLPRQPPALYQLASAAKCKHNLEPHTVQHLLADVEPLLRHLVPAHLVHAAWAAAQLADLCPPSQEWQQELLIAAGLCFELANTQQPAAGAAGAKSSIADDAGDYDGRVSDAAAACDPTRVMGATSIAALLQALVKLEHQPSQAWLSACCSSMAVQQWTCPRALSTVAACLPQLAYAPSHTWAQQFFAASAANLAAFPPISLARMLHGVTAWQRVRQQQQSQGEQSLSGRSNDMQQPCYIPESWLLGVCLGLVNQSSKLKAAEVSMVLQSMQRLQQQHDSLLLPPAAGQQPSTPLQQAGQQLLHALMAAALQQLDHFKSKDLTVMLLAVAGLHDKQQLGQQDAQQQQQQQQQLQSGHQGVAWCWLQRVLASVQTHHLPKLDPRGQAACLAAAAALIKPHLQQQQLQLQLQAAMRVKPLQHQQQRQPLGPPSSSTQPPIVKPLQRWLQQQQTRAAPAAESSTPPAAGMAVRGDEQRHVLAHPLNTSVQHLDASVADVACRWQQLLTAFYAASSQQLSTYSPTDLTVTTCTLASMQQVPPVDWYEQMLHAIQQQLPAMSGGQVSGVAWALGRMAMLPSQHNAAVSLVPSAAWLQRLYPAGAAAEYIRRQPQKGGRVDQLSSPLPVAAAAASVMSRDQLLTRDSAEVEAVLAAGSSHCTYSLWDCSPAEVVRLMWAAAVCDYDAAAEWLAAAEQQIMAAAAVQECEALTPPCSASGQGSSSSSSSNSSSGTASAAAASSNSSSVVHKSSCSSQELPVHMLGMLLQAYAAAGRPVPPSMLEQLVYCPTVMQQLVHGPTVNVVKLLRGLRQAACDVPLGWLKQLAVQLQPQLTLVPPGELPQLLGCLADAGLNLQRQGSGGTTPNVTSGNIIETSERAECSEACCSSTYSSSGFRLACLDAALVLLSRMSVQDAGLLLWSCAKLRLQPPAAWLDSVLQALQASFLTAELPALVLVLAACAKLGYMPSRIWLGDFMMATHRKVAAMAVSPDSGKRLLVRVVLQLLWGLAGLGASPNPKWTKLLLLAVHQQLPLMTPRHVTSLLLVLARLKVKPSTVFLQSVVDRLGDFTSCSSTELVKLVYAAAALRWVPSRRCSQLLLSATAGRLCSLPPVGLAVLQWSLAVLRITPPEAWKAAAVDAVVAHLNEFDAQCLGMVVWAWGRQMVHLVPKPYQDKTVSRQEFLQQRLQQLSMQGQQLNLQDRQQRLAWLLQRRKLLEQQHLQQQNIQSTQKPVPDMTVRSNDMTSSSTSRGGSDGLSSKRRQVFAQRAGVAERVLAAALRLKGTYSAAGLVHLLVGVAKMRLAAGQPWLQDMVMHGSSEKLSVLNGYELQQLVWALAKLGYRAQAAWLDNVAVLLEVRVTQQQDSTRHSAAWALERLRQLAAQEEQQ